MTVITGLSLNADGFKDLSRELKQKCGTGGTVKAGVIQIQGDHRDLLVEELKARGYVVKRTGG
jgi:translation initiation factor 1